MVRNGGEPKWWLKSNVTITPPLESTVSPYLQILAAVLCALCKTSPSLCNRTPYNTAFEQDRLIREQLMEKKDIQDWEFDEPSQFAKFVAPKDMPPTPILDAYEMSRDPEEMERLIKMAFDSLPERAGPRRNNHRRRQHQKFRMIRVRALFIPRFRCVRGVHSLLDFPVHIGGREIAMFSATLHTNLPLE